jgi:N-dimethylarginine dimethylaminohydrolase
MSRLIESHSEQAPDLKPKPAETQNRECPARFRHGILWDERRLPDAALTGGIPSWWASAYRGFRAAIEDSQFADPSLQHTRLLFTFAESGHVPEHLESIRQALLEYIGEVNGLDLVEARLTVLVIMIRPADPPRAIDDYEQEMWSILQYLHDRDSQPWPAEIPTSPDHPSWSYCFGGQALFIKCGTPAHTERRDRNLGPALTLLIQKRDGIDLLMPVERTDGTPPWKLLFVPDISTRRRGRCPLRLHVRHDGATVPAQARPAIPSGGERPATATMPGTPAPSAKMLPSMLPLPVFLLCPPLSLSTEVANNIWMQEYSPRDRTINRSRAMDQFLTLYQFLASVSLVYLLPASPDCELQDITFAGNAAFIPEHLPDRDVALISNFTSLPRRGESEITARFFEALGYRTLPVPYRFEGDAEIKHLHDNIYIGGYGGRSERRAYPWMAEQFDMTVVAVEETDPHLYHLDCSVFPIDRENTLVCTDLFTAAEIAAIERYTNIIDATKDECFSGICNSIRVHNMILNASDLCDEQAGTELYNLEVKKNRKLEDIATRFCCELVFFNLNEFLKSGALLSCLVMQMNRYSYGIRLY